MLQKSVDFPPDISDEHPEHVNEWDENHAADHSQACYQRLVAPVQDGVDEVVALLARVQLYRQARGLAWDGDADGSGVCERRLVATETCATGSPVNNGKHCVGQPIDVDVSKVARLHAPPAGKSLFTVWVF